MKKTYVLTISQYFPKTHKRLEEETGFIRSIANHVKIHTIRANYELWKKRADKINAGEARLSVREWTGKPYQSKQREVFVFEKIGVEKLQLDILGWFIDDCDNDVDTSILAKNDGLSTEDFKEWFKKYDMKKPLAIIHFSDFRYKE